MRVKVEVFSPIPINTQIGPEGPLPVRAVIRDLSQGEALANRFNQIQRRKPIQNRAWAQVRYAG